MFYISDLNSEWRALGRDIRSSGRLRSILCAAVFAVVLADSAPAQAHTGGTLGGLLSGFEHPLLGPDHLLAMFAVGVWGAQIGGRSIWELPVIFPLIMSLGAMFGIAGFWGPQVAIVQVGIGLSVLGLGLAIAARWSPVEAISIAAVGIFALFHGYAHGVELPTAADPVAYAFGFVMATGLIHCAGIGFGLVLGSANLRGSLGRVAGALIALTGAWFLHSPP